MDPVGDLLGDQGGVAAGPVVDNEVHLDLVFYSLVHDLNGILDHLRVQHTADHLVDREGLGIGFLVGHPKGRDKSNDCLFPRVEEHLIDLSKLFPQRRQPGPVGKDQSYPMLLKDLKEWIRQVGLCAEFNVIPGIFGNVVKECVQVLGQFCRWDPVVLGMVFLLKDEPV